MNFTCEQGKTTNSPGAGGAGASSCRRLLLPRTSQCCCDPAASVRQVDEPSNRSKPRKQRGVAPLRSMAKLGCKVAGLASRDLPAAGMPVAYALEIDRKATPIFLQLAWCIRWLMERKFRLPLWLALMSCTSAKVCQYHPPVVYGGR